MQTAIMNPQIVGGYQWQNKIKTKGAVMTEYKINNATVRIHGNADPEKVRSATEKYLKKVVRSKKNEKSHKEKLIQG
jgi:hypothetical protein